MKELSHKRFIIRQIRKEDEVITVVKKPEEFDKSGHREISVGDAQYVDCLV